MQHAPSDHHRPSRLRMPEGDTPTSSPSTQDRGHSRRSSLISNQRSNDRTPTNFDLHALSVPEYAASASDDLLDHVEEAPPSLLARKDSLEDDGTEGSPPPRVTCIPLRGARRALSAPNLPPLTNGLERLAPRRLRGSDASHQRPHAHFDEQSTTRDALICRASAEGALEDDVDVEEEYECFGRRRRPQTTGDLHASEDEDSGSRDGSCEASEDSASLHSDDRESAFERHRNPMRMSSADDDIDETCMEPAGIAKMDLDSEQDNETLEPVDNDSPCQYEPSTASASSKDGNWLQLNAPEVALGPGISLIDRVNSKLVAWSWARENGTHDAEGEPIWIPLLAFEDRGTRQTLESSEGPLSPPNTERPSGASSTKHSAPRSPRRDSEEQYDEDVGDEDDESLEMRVNVTPSGRSGSERASEDLECPTKKTYSLPDTPGVEQYLQSRQLSDIASWDGRFMPHRDSLVLLRKRRHDDQTGLNQRLMNSEDSVIFTRLKLDTRLSRSSESDMLTWKRRRNLSPILDASRRNSGTGSQDDKVISGPATRQSQAKHPSWSEEHVGCPIYEVERPRWFAAKFKKGLFMGS